MTGEVLSEMVKISGLPHRTLERRIQRAGIKPITKEAVYPIGTYEKIKDAKMGRPKNATNEKPINTTNKKAIK